MNKKGKDKKPVREKLPKLMSQYEQDLTWMAYRYAIGRHTIHADCMCKDMARNIPGRVTPERARFFGEDIQREIAMQLRFQPFFFQVERVDINIPVAPLDCLFEFYQRNKMTSLNDLLCYKSITCGVIGESTWKYVEVPLMDGDKKTAYNISFEVTDLMSWSNLAKLLDARFHRFALCKNPKDLSERIVVPYFLSYKMTNEDGGMLFEQVKIPCEAFCRNAYISCTLNEDWIVEDGISKEEAEKYAVINLWEE